VVTLQQELVKKKRDEKRKTLGVIKANDDVRPSSAAKRGKDDSLKPLMPISVSNGDVSPYCKYLIRLYLLRLLWSHSVYL